VDAFQSTVSYLDVGAFASSCGTVFFHKVAYAELFHDVAKVVGDERFVFFLDEACVVVGGGVVVVVVVVVAEFFFLEDCFGVPEGVILRCVDG
jgi:hypothetical protein